MNIVGSKMIILIILKYEEGAIKLSEKPSVSPKFLEVSLMNTIDPNINPTCCIKVWRKLTN